MSKTFRRNKRQWDDDYADNNRDNIKSKRRNAEDTRNRKQTREQMLEDLLHQNVEE